VAKIAHGDFMMVDLKPKVKRNDAIQIFVSQETPLSGSSMQTELLAAGMPIPSARVGGIMSLIEQP
jgi:hypothetical protein